MRMRAGIVSARRRASSGVSPLYTYDWSSGNTSGTLTRSGSATYIDASGSRVSAAANTARFTYDGKSPNSFLGLMIEPASANRFLQSSDLTNASWSKENVSVVNNNAGTGLSGPNTLDTITVTASSAKIGQEIAIPSGSTVTMTWYMKAGSGRWMVATLYDIPNYADGDSCWVDLLTGTVGEVWSGGASVFGTTHSAEMLANGIVKYSITSKTAGLTSVWAQIELVSGNATYSPSAVGATYVFDSAQIEIAPSFGTSYIPTTTASVSRGAETLSVSMANGLYDLLVRDAGGYEWRDGVSVSNGSYNVLPREGQYHVRGLAAYSADVLTAAQKDALTLEDTFTYRQGYNLVWSDEFNDTNVARFSETGTVTSSGGGKPWKAKLHFDGRSLNNESQIYTNATYLGINPFSVSNGTLRITANVIPDGTSGIPTNNNYNPPSPYKFYSGLITTEIERNWTYGVFEARCRNEAKHGVWPAFWLYFMPDAPSSQQGELDIIENIGDWPDRTSQNVHEYDYSQGTDPIASDGSEYYFPNAGDVADWHIYACKWEPGRIRWYVDGILTKDVSTTWLDNTPMFILLNLALNTSAWTGIDGSTGAGDPLLSDLPTYLDVDYVRVYQT